MEFGQILSALLVKNHYTQASLAEFVGVKPNTVSDWIKKGTSPKIEHLYKIADFFNVSFDYLFQGKESKNIGITQSNVAAIGENSSGTININNPDYPETSDEIAKEIIRIVKALPLRERSQLLTLIYEFEQRFSEKPR